jgi:hypothetical protein
MTLMQAPTSVFNHRAYHTLFVHISWNSRIGDRIRKSHLCLGAIKNKILHATNPQGNELLLWPLVLCTLTPQSEGPLIDFI